MDCILFRRESYSSQLRSTRPLTVVGPVENSCGAEGGDRIPKDPMLSSIYANEEDKAGEAQVGLREVPSIDPQCGWSAGNEYSDRTHHD